MGPLFRRPTIVLDGTVIRRDRSKAKINKAKGMQTLNLGDRGDCASRCHIRGGVPIQRDGAKEQLDSRIYGPAWATGAQGVIAISMTFPRGRDPIVLPVSPPGAARISDEKVSRIIARHYSNAAGFCFLLGGKGGSAPLCRFFPSVCFPVK